MKKTLRTIIALAMSSAVILSLGACGGSKPAETTNAPETKASETTAAQPDTTAAETEATIAYPESDITFIVPYAAGGTTDLLARALSDQMAKDLGVNVIVQNVEGGGGTTGTSQAVNSKADGYTLAICSNGGYLINPEVNEVGYTYETTSPICIVSEIPIALAVAGSSPYKTLKEFVDASKAAPGSVTYSTPGANSTPNLLAAAVALQEGATWNHSPNSSSPAAIAELIGGHIDAVCVNLPTFASYTESGDVRLLAVTGEERDPDYPDVPTFKELGYDFPASVYFCIVGPKDMDPQVIKAISDAVGKAMDNETVIENFNNLKFPMTFVDCDAFAARVTADHDLYMGILKDLGVVTD